MLLASLGLLAGIAPCHRSVPPIDLPPYLQVELIEAAPLGACGSASYYFGLRVLKLTYHSGRGLRAGISMLDGGGPLTMTM